ncbi:MAG: hypothetical protein LUQ25_08985 [Methanoregulaceae archaeon]|nr:hypothetical protein [Methanoregulaceae archaeon]
MKSRKSGKEEKRSGWTWQKTGAVAVGLFFVVVMVVSSLGTGWLTGLVTVKPGDSVVINYTLRDNQGRPVVTTDQKLYTDTIQNRQIVLYTGPRLMAANMTATGSFSPIDVYFRGDTMKFGLFSEETNRISQGVVGMKTGEQKRINIGLPVESLYYIPMDRFEEYFGNETEIAPGVQVPLFLSDQESVPLMNDTPSNIYVRIASIVNQSPEGVTLDYGYSAADVTMVRINNE